VGTVAIRDGQLRHLEPVRCQACGRLLFKIDEDALKAAKVVEIKCKCDALNYRIGKSTS
jgi:phage FluMu protein Com